MKKITVPGIREESELVCDVTGKEAVASLNLVFGYGSTNHDGQELLADLSDETANEVLALLQARFPQLQLAEYSLLNREWGTLAENHGALLRLVKYQNVSKRRRPVRKPAKKKPGQ